MLIEVHVLQNHSPANLNRDDLGAPKTCVFGGVTRARISSQCLKRSIRRSDEFQAALERDGGVRTRRLITLVAEEAHGSSPAPDDLLKLVAEAFEKGGVKRAATREDANAPTIRMFVPESAIAAMADAVREAKAAKKKPDELCEAFAEILGRKASVPDVALSGRMTELDGEGLFRKVDFHVEAALSAAHAISTHEVINEVDYFTAVDDRASGTGAGHVNEAMFASACFYKYFSIHWERLVENLAGDVELARLTLRRFLSALALTTPTGKQKSFAAFNPPEGVLVEVKTDRCVPVSYANAFADPVPLRGPRPLVAESVARLGQYVHETVDGYGLRAERFWFSPGGRYALTYVDDKQERPLVEDGAFVASLDDLIGAVDKVVASAQGA